MVKDLSKTDDIEAFRHMNLFEMVLSEKMETIFGVDYAHGNDTSVTFDLRWCFQCQKDSFAAEYKTQTEDGMLTEVICHECKSVLHLNESASIPSDLTLPLVEPEIVKDIGCMVIFSIATWLAILAFTIAVNIS